MSLIWKSSLLRWQRCTQCPGAPKPGCGSCHGGYGSYGYGGYGYGGYGYGYGGRCGCFPCVQVPLDNRIVFRNACCEPKHDCDCDDCDRKHKPKHCGCDKPRHGCCRSCE